MLIKIKLFVSNNASMYSLIFGGGFIGDGGVCGVASGILVTW